MAAPQLIDPDLKQRLMQLPVPTITATLAAKGIANGFLAGLMPLDAGNARFVGTAYTLRALPLREDLLRAVGAGAAPNLHRQAMREVEAGQVLVTDSGGDAGISFFGELISTFLARKGVAAIVTDAGIADVADVMATGLPVFCQGSAPIPGTARRVVADLQRPVDCRGVTVCPGDVLVGDANGVAVIPRAMAQEVAEAAADKERLERFLLEQLKNGAPLDGTYPPDAEMMAAYRGAVESM
ncbi:MAG: ribonuclease activity regulator RraA [Pseudomonadota bacterium]